MMMQIVTETTSAATAIENRTLIMWVSLLRPQPDLDQTADGFGAGWQIFLLAAPLVDCGDIRGCDHYGNTEFFQFVGHRVGF